MEWYQANLGLIQTIIVTGMLTYSIQVVLRAGIFSLASVGFYGIGAYTAAVLVGTHGWALIPTLLVVVVSCWALSIALYLPLRRISGLSLAMATFAFDLGIGVVALNWDSVTGGPLGLYAIPVAMSTGEALALLVVATIILWYLERGAIGRAIEALRELPDISGAMGVETAKLRSRIFSLSAVLGGLSGASGALMFNIVQPTDFGFELIVTGLTMAIIGGSRSWVGALIGTVIFLWLPQALVSFAEWRDAALGAALVIILLFAPDGILGLLTRLRQRIRDRRSVEHESTQVPSTGGERA